LLNVAPPYSTGLPAGVSPASVTNPQLRAEYERAIARNRARIQQYNEQSWLRLDGSRIQRQVEKYLVDAYSRAPSHLQELQQLLSHYINDASVRDRVLGGVLKSEKR